MTKVSQVSVKEVLETGKFLPNASQVSQPEVQEEASQKEVKTVLRETEASYRSDKNGALQGPFKFSYKALDMGHYMTDAASAPCQAIMALAKRSMDVAAQAAYRQQRLGSKTVAAKTHDAACKYMLEEYDSMTGEKKKTDKAAKLAVEVGKLSAEDRAKLLALLSA